MIDITDPTRSRLSSTPSSPAKSHPKKKLSTTDAPAGNSKSVTLAAGALKTSSGMDLASYSSSSHKHQQQSRTKSENIVVGTWVQKDDVKLSSPRILKCEEDLIIPMEIDHDVKQSRRPPSKLTKSGGKASALPTEILLQILTPFQPPLSSPPTSPTSPAPSSLLSLSSTLSTLVQCTLVCKSWNRVATPLLYTSPLLKSPQSFEKMLDALENPFKSPTLHASLIKTLPLPLLLSEAHRNHLILSKLFTRAVLETPGLTSNLTTLDLSFVKGVSNYTLQKTAHLLGNLEALNLGGTAVSEICVIKLARSCGRSLRRLGLGWNQGVGDFGIREVVGVCENLEWLDLSGCARVTDAGCLAIAKALGKKETIRNGGFGLRDVASPLPITPSFSNSTTNFINPLTPLVPSHSHLSFFSPPPRPSSAPPFMQPHTSTHPPRKGLRHLSLNYCTNLTPTGITALLHPQTTRLETLNVVGCSNVRFWGVQVLEPPPESLAPVVSGDLEFLRTPPPVFNLSVDMETGVDGEAVKFVKHLKEPKEEAVVALCFFGSSSSVVAQQASGQSTFKFFFTLRNGGSYTLPLSAPSTPPPTNSTSNSTLPLPPSNAGSTNEIVLSWSWDTCAGYPPPFNALPPAEGLGCVDPNTRNPLQGYNPRNVFSSVENFVLRRNFPSGPTFQEFPLFPTRNPLDVSMGDTITSLQRNLPMPSLVFNAASVFPGGFTWNDLKSDYYSFVLSATDTLGRSVQGQSQIFVLRGTDPLPDINSVQLVTPVMGSILLANKDTLVRWTLTPTADIYPDGFTLELLNANGDSIPNYPLIYNASNAFFIDPQYSTNATVWSVPANATNGRYRLKWTGVFRGPGGPLGARPPMAVSDVFTVGPVYSKDIVNSGAVKWHGGLLLSSFVVIVAALVVL
ncbi:hypothetical protein HDV05_008765 [Chytridiales sp. JEL 0842]|nr:hypothetical protein HDV05_008765 [Chytridiales sp. JEL 0842]